MTESTQLRRSVEHLLPAPGARYSVPHDKHAPYPIDGKPPREVISKELADSRLRLKRHFDELLSKK